jgi:uncharacterized protein (UPF0333 family)
MKTSTTKKRGQVSVEFIVILAVILVIFIAVLHAMQTRRAHTGFISDELAARRVADAVAGAVSRLVMLGDGSLESHYIPLQLDGRTNYTITIYNESHEVVVSWGNYLYSSTLVTSRMNTTTIPRGKTVLFRNDEGVISIG